MTLTKTLTPFQAHPLMPGGHLQTILGYYLPQIKQLRPHKVHLVEVDAGDKLAVLENMPGRRASFKKIIVLMHGLGGDDSSPYMLRLADLFVKRGWTVFRMNHRGCGMGKGLARGLYHSGRSDDICRVLQFIEHLYPDIPTLAVGFSLSGNALLKLLGENVHRIAGNLKGAVAVTPPIDLAGCADELCRQVNRMYDLRFVRMLKTAIHERCQTFPDFQKITFPRKMNIRDFDELCTAPLSGFQSAKDYYNTCSANQFLPTIRTPTFLLASLNDPFIPKETFTGIKPHSFLTIYLTQSGGHMGFVAKNKTSLGSRRWMDYAILTSAEQLLKK